MKNKFPISSKGYKKLTQELNFLKNIERPKVIKDIVTGRSHGDLSENSEYHAAKEKQYFLESKISKLEDNIFRSEIINDFKCNGNIVRYGASVTLLDKASSIISKYKIVSDYESDVDKGLISLYSPLSKALIGKKLHDNFKFKTFRTTKYYKIIKVCYI